MNKLVKYLIKLPIFREVYRQGGVDSFPLAHKDIMETMRDDLDKQAESLANKKLHDLIAPVLLESVISLDKRGIIYINGEKVEETRLVNLCNEALALEQFDLWKVMHSTGRSLAERAMFVDDGQIENQLIKGRAILYALDSQKKIIDLLKSYSQSQQHLQAKQKV